MTGGNWRAHPKHLILVVVLAAACRLLDLGWDDGLAFHPDERAIIGAVERISFSEGKLNPEFFAYGSLPIYAIRIASSTAEALGVAEGYQGHILVGRLLSAFTGTLSVLLLYAIGSRLYGRKIGIAAAFLLATCTLPIQSSHFATTDTTLTFLVLATLLAILSAIRRSDTTGWLITGLLLGCALATKVSALPLLLPIGVGLVATCRPLSLLVRRAFTIVLSAAIAFSIAQPYAWLSFDSFWRQIGEQGRMVRSAGDMPYTIQYVGTWKYLYDTEQILLWGMGPALAILCFWGLARLARQSSRRPSIDEWILLSFVLSAFAISGWFEVKYLRYLLPIYPILILWGAKTLVEAWQGGRRQRLLASLALGLHLVFTLAFLTTYRGEHTTLRASDWLYRNAPSGSRLLRPHWEEGFPHATDLGHPSAFDVEVFPYYEPDNTEKLEELALSLAEADFVCFPTKRIYGSITRDPDRFPLTHAFLGELFAGGLGFELAHVEASRPSLFGLTLPDELADESLSVYDHPKVLIFEKTEELGSEELLHRLSRPPSPRLPSRSEMLLAGGAGEPQTMSPVRCSVLALLLFAFAVLLLWQTVFTILVNANLLPSGLPERSRYALGAVLGPLVLAWLALMGEGIGALAFDSAALRLIVLGLMALALFLRGKRLRGAGAPSPRSFLSIQLLFWFFFLAVLAMRLHSPAIFWGEKPMDFSFLNVLDRSDSLPPADPWFALSTLRYTYFGHLIVASLAKLLHLDPGLAFNLGVAWVGGATACAAYAAGLALTGRRRSAYASVGLVLVLGNLSGIATLLERKSLDFDTFWATSRVIDSTINEYPLWSLLFADLHAHLLALPIGLTCLALILGWTRVPPRADGSVRSRELAVIALAFGALATTNGWSVPAFATLAILLLTLALPDQASSIGMMRRIGRGLLLPGIVLFAGAFLLYLPFWLHYGGPPARWGWEHQSGASLADYGQIFGLFLLIGIPVAVMEWLGRGVRLGTKFRWLDRLALATAFLLILADPFLPGQHTLRWGLLLVGISTVMGSLGQGDPVRRRALALFGAAIGLTALCDIVFLWDRMNTIFKYYWVAWSWLAVASSALIFDSDWRRARPRLAWSWKTALALTTILALSTSLLVIVIRARFERIPTTAWTLDGRAFLTESNPADSSIIEWLNRHVQGVTPILEAWGPSYGEYARISSHTGLPTVLGWSYHLEQRGLDQREIEQRKADVGAIYAERDSDRMRELLEVYDVSYLVWGPLEQRTYPGTTRAHLEKHRNLLRPVFSSGETTLFQVSKNPATSRSARPWRAAGPRPEAAIPTRGPGLSQPRAMAVTADGRRWAADFAHHRIAEIDDRGEVIASFGQKGEARASFKEPCDVAAWSGDRLLVADTWNHRIQVLLPAEGKVEAIWTGGLFGPRAVAPGPGNRVFVADTGNHRIVVFSADGQVLETWGEQGRDEGQFSEPSGLVVSESGEIWVADVGNGRIQHLSSDGKSLSAFPVDGWRLGPMSEPKLAMGPDATIWATVPLEGTVRSYELTGEMRAELRSALTLTGDRVELSRPLGIARDATRELMVITDLDRILILPDSERK